MDVFYTDTAKRQLKKLERHVQERIVDKMRFSPRNPTRSNLPNLSPAMTHFASALVTIV